MNDRPIDLNDLAPRPTRNPLAGDHTIRRHQLAWMADRLAQITYKPSWQLHLAEVDNEPVLVVHYTASDSRGVGHDVRLSARRPLTPTTDPEAFVRDVAKRLIDIEAHELWEWLRFDGQLVADPHADPDRWHCPCGGVGPVKRANTWRCPGCGTEHMT